MLSARSRQFLLRPCVRRAMCAASLAASLGASSTAHAVQHLVRPGEDWERLSARVRPGDAIVLMPGTHDPANFDSLVGTAENPIIIRGADPKNPSIIVAQREGIRIRRAAHVIIKDLAIQEGSICGISAGDGVASDVTVPALALPAPTEDQPQEPQGFAGPLTIENVSVSRVGPRGQRHGILIWGLQQVRIDGCRFEGWGGSAIEVQGCRDVSISNCTFKGLEGHSQMTGVRLRAGCDRARIEHCRFENAGERVICLGGASDPVEFRPALPPRTPEASAATTKSPLLFEASRVNVERCVIVGGKVALTLHHADDCLVRNLTIVRPTESIVSLLAEQSDPRFTPNRRNIFGYNLVTWEPGDLKQLAEVGQKADPEGLVLESNLLWSTEAGEAREKLGNLPGKSMGTLVTDVNPQLDVSLHPQAPRAAGYGAGD